MPTGIEGNRSKKQGNTVVLGKSVTAELLRLVTYFVTVTYLSGRGGYRNPN